MGDLETGNHGKWTIMVYMVADGTLANFGIYSLKQLQQAAGNGVVVAAQFAAPKRHALRLIFDGASKARSLESIGVKLPAGTEMDDPKTLTDFVCWAHDQCKTDYYCLILWGHGPELLIESPPRPASRETGKTNGRQHAANGSEGKRVSLYFTPVQLAKALADANKKINVIGMDACSMSLAEFAYELRDVANFMVASQEEVPDFSFPYSALVQRFSNQNGGGIAALCQATVEAFVESYQDYIFNNQTNTAPVTLSALDLGKIGTITGPLKDLAGALKGSAVKPQIADAIYQARQQAQDFVGGLFVDLPDFCDRLKSHLPGLEQICNAVSQAIRLNGNGTGCVIANRVQEPQKNCNGLSIYFPYLQDQDKQEKLDRPYFTKGSGGDGGKGSGGDGGKNLIIADAAVTNALYAARREIIEDTENYYQNSRFNFATDTDWYEFIQHDWSRILAKKEPDKLDIRYSAQQCAQNLLSSLPSFPQEEVPPEDGPSSRAAAALA